MKFARLREKTIKAYTGHVRNALEKIGKKPEKLKSDDLNEFLVQLYDNNYSMETIKAYNAALKYFFENTLKKKWRRKLVIRRGKSTTNHIRPLTRSEIKRLLKNTQTLKYQLIFTLMYSSGLRITEVCHLKPNDINPEDMLINVEFGKGGTKRQTVLSNKALELIHEYQKFNPNRTWLFPAGRKKYSNGYLFKLPDEDKPLSTRAVHREFQLVSKQIGLPGYARPHSLRHSFATHLIEDGLSIFAVQKLMGHNFLRTTLKYLRFVEVRPQLNFSPYDRF